MKLDIKDRFIISNQLKILEKLYPEEQETYESNRKAIEYGFELHYDWIMEHIYEGLNSEECNFVLNVLDMYASMLHSYNKLKSENIKKDDVIFRGFDGNNETMYMAYARYFLEDLDRYREIQESSNNYYNSHSQMVSKYKHMLSKYNKYKQSYTYDLTEDHLLDIINTY